MVLRVALALLHEPELWRDENRVRAELELEALRDYKIENILAMLRAHTTLVDSYWAGVLIRDADPTPPRFGVAATASEHS